MPMSTLYQLVWAPNFQSFVSLGIIWVYDHLCFRQLRQSVMHTYNLWEKTPAISTFRAMEDFWCFAIRFASISYGVKPGVSAGLTASKERLGLPLIRSKELTYIPSWEKEHKQPWTDFIWHDLLHRTLISPPYQLCWQRDLSTRSVRATMSGIGRMQQTGGGPR